MQKLEAIEVKLRTFYSQRPTLVAAGLVVGGLGLGIVAILGVALPLLRKNRAVLANELRSGIKASALSVAHPRMMSRKGLPLKITSHLPQIPENMNPTLPIWASSQEALFKDVVGFDSDVVCLQRIRPEFFENLSARLEPLGYKGVWTKRISPQGQVLQRDWDYFGGMATFYRTDRLELVSHQNIFSHDTATRYGNLAHALDFRIDGEEISVINTHLLMSLGDLDGMRFDPGPTSTIKFLTNKIMQSRKEMKGIIVCGDFSHGGESTMIQSLRSFGFTDTHSKLEEALRAARKVAGGAERDHILVYKALSSEIEGAQAFEKLLATPGNAFSRRGHIPLTGRIWF